jgi:hypothetical protein
MTQPTPIPHPFQPPGGSPALGLAIASAEPPRSLMDKLSPADQQDLLRWAASQPLGPSGGVDLMAWPGWAAALLMRNPQPTAKATP